MFSFDPPNEGGAGARSPNSDAGAAGVAEGGLAAGLATSDLGGALGGADAATDETVREALDDSDVPRAVGKGTVSTPKSAK